MTVSAESKGGAPLPRAHINGIDYLRAIMSLFVVVWHMGGAGQSLVFSRKDFASHVFEFSDLINFHVLLLAVPVFIFIAIYLYSLNPPRWSGLFARLRRIFLLLSFWPLVFIVYNGGVSSLAAMRWSPPASAVYTVLQAGGTIYYFFPSLIVCFVVAFGLLHLPRPWQIACVLSSLTVLAALPVLTTLSRYYVASAYWNPINFVPLTCVAVLVAQSRSSLLARRFEIIVIASGLCVLSSIWEWHTMVGAIFFAGQSSAFPAYTRPSLIFAALAIFLVALDPRIKSPAIIRFMARNSLALYCLHPFLIAPVGGLVARLPFSPALLSVVLMNH